MLRGSATCAICAGDSFEYLNTYKHRWAFCLHCGNAEREGKERYPMERQPLKLALQIAMRLLRAAGRTYDLSPIFLHDRDVIADERMCYLYEQDCRLTYETTKWKGYDDLLLRRLRELGVTLDAKRVLSVSDGPGFLARRVKELVAEIVITEFSDRAVAAMRSVLGVEALTYDLNRDSLSAIVQGKRFDVVLLRSCVAFCTDLPALSSEIAKVIAPGGVLVVGVHPPSLGGSLQWMFGEYIPVFWYQPETVVRHMTSRGFELLAPYTRFKTVTDPKKRYPMTWKERVMFRPFWWFYYLESLVRSRAFPPALDECCYDVFFRWRGLV